MNGVFLVLGALVMFAEAVRLAFKYGGRDIDSDLFLQNAPLRVILWVQANLLSAFAFLWLGVALIGMRL